MLRHSTFVTGDRVHGVLHLVSVLSPIATNWIKSIDVIDENTDEITTETTDESTDDGNCSSVWDPYHKSDKFEIKRFQRRAARFVTGVYKRE